MTNLTPESEAARELARTGAGTFGNKIPSTDGRIVGFTADDVDPQSTVDDVVAAVATNAAEQPYTYDFIYVDQDDKLTVEQMTDYLSGNLDAMYMSIQESYADDRDDQVLQLARNLCSDAGLDYDELDEDDQAQVRTSIEEEETSDPLDQLLRNTPEQLLRAPLITNILHAAVDGGADSVLVYDDRNYEAQANARQNIILDALQGRGVDVHDLQVREAVAELVNEGPSHWHDNVTLDVMWSGPVEEAASAKDFREEQLGRTLGFDGGAHLLLMDKDSGSGWAVELPGPITVTVTPKAPAFIDSAVKADAGGVKVWGWEDTTGGVSKGELRPTNMTSVWVNAQDERG
jgi:hypothetical protein